MSGPDLLPGDAPAPTGRRSSAGGGRGRWDSLLDVDFRAGGFRFHDLTGWSEPEWTVGDVFAIDLGRLSRRSRAMVRLTAAPFLTQHFEAECNGVPCGSLSTDRPFVATFPVPQPVAQAGERLRFSVRLAEPKRPCDHGDTPDVRRLGLSIARIEVLGSDVEDRDAWPGTPSEPASLQDSEVLARFESLGDNCELGFVQKRAGLQESSLLRFCATPVDSLLDGLAHGFASIDAPGQLALTTDGPADAREYQVVLSRYRLHYHTLTFTHQASEPAVYERELGKLRHKHDKFLDGLSQSDRVYVLKQNDELALPVVRTVWLALQRYGANTLLWVRKVRPGEAPGDVRVLAPGLLEGTVADFASYSDATQGCDQAWIALCRRALELIGDRAR